MRVNYILYKVYIFNFWGGILYIFRYFIENKLFCKVIRKIENFGVIFVLIIFII